MGGAAKHLCLFGIHPIPPFGHNYLHHSHMQNALTCPRPLEVWSHVALCPVPVLLSSGVGPDVSEAPWRQQLRVVSLDLGTCEIKRQIACPVTQHIMGKPTLKGEVQEAQTVSGTQQF